MQKYRAIRDELKLMSGDYVDLRVFDSAMRYLIDSYIHATNSERLFSFKDKTLLDIILRQGLQGAIDVLPEDIAKNKEALAETIENNVRKLIIDKRDINSAYYDKMSQILKGLIEKRKKEVIEYVEYLKQMEKLIKDVETQGDSDSQYPQSIIESAGEMAIYDNLDNIEIEDREGLTNKIDEYVKKNRKDNWRGHKIKERQVKHAISKAIDDYFCQKTIKKNTLAEPAPPYLSFDKNEMVERIFEIIKKHEEY